MSDDAKDKRVHNCSFAACQAISFASSAVTGYKSDDAARKNGIRGFDPTSGGVGSGRCKCLCLVQPKVCGKHRLTQAAEHSELAIS